MSEAHDLLLRAEVRSWREHVNAEPMPTPRVLTPRARRIIRKVHLGEQLQVDETLTAEVLAEAGHLVRFTVDGKVHFLEPARYKWCREIYEQ